MATGIEFRGLGYTAASVAQNPREWGYWSRMRVQSRVTPAPCPSIPDRRPPIRGFETCGPGSYPCNTPEAAATGLRGLGAWYDVPNILVFGCAEAQAALQRLKAALNQYSAAVAMSTPVYAAAAAYYAQNERVLLNSVGYCSDAQARAIVAESARHVSLLNAGLPSGTNPVSPGSAVPTPEPSKPTNWADIFKDASGAVKWGAIAVIAVAAAWTLSPAIRKASGLIPAGKGA